MRRLSLILLLLPALSLSCVVRTTPSKNSTTVSVQPASAADLSREEADSTEKDAQAILSHKWWAKLPTKKQLDDVVEFYVETNRQHFVWVSEDFRLTRQGAQFGDRDLPLPAQEPRYRPAFDPKSRFLSFYLDDSTRPTRAIALRRIRALLDANEYRDGPAQR